MSAAAPLADRIRDAALELGFARVGFAEVEPFARGQRALEDWLGHGHHGELVYMAPAEPRATPATLLAEAKTVVVVALAYCHPEAPESADPARGLVARFARGTDYHMVLKAKLQALARRIAEIAGRSVLARPCVDSAPLLEREAAHRAGVGFIAKSTLAISPGIGTYVLLGELLLDVELPPSEPATSKCGTCTLCLAACPTGAFVGPFVLDARRCISYLTIELRGVIPRDLRPLMGRWVFGCDVCQEVCPWNAGDKSPMAAPELAPRAELTAPALEDLLLVGSAEHRKLVRRSAWRRVSRPQLQRNAAVALGNAGLERSLPALGRALELAAPLVRGHVAWAVGRVGGSPARALLDAALTRERDAYVIGELRAARRDAAQSTASSAITGT